MTKDLESTPNYTSVDYRLEHILPLMKKTTGKLNVIEKSIKKKQKILPKDLVELIQNHIEHMLLAISYEQVVSYRVTEEEAIPLDDFRAMHALFRSTPDMFQTYQLTEEQQQAHENILKYLDNYVEKETNLIQALPFETDQYYNGLVIILENLIKSNVLILSKIFDDDYRKIALPYLITSIVEQLFIYNDKENPFITSYAQYTLAFFDQSLKEQMLK